MFTTKESMLSFCEQLKTESEGDFFRMKNKSNEMSAAQTR
jgi:hypothetical protein